jgi:hypothetical protein
MVETVQIKLEADREGFSAPPPSNHNQMTSHVTSTSNNDSVLSAAVESIYDIDRICLVKIRQKDAEGNIVDTRLWPGLLFSSQNELLKAVESSGMAAFTKIVRSIKQQKKKGYKFSHGIAFLLGRQTIEDSILLLGEHMLESFDDHIDELLEKDDYKNNPEFMASVAIVKKLMFSSDKDDEQDSESQSDDGTVAIDFDNTMPSPSSNNQASAAEEDGQDDKPQSHNGTVVLDLDNTMPSPSSNNQSSAAEVMPGSSGGKDKKRKSEGKNDGNVSKKKTPKGKSRESQPSVVTPPHPKAKRDKVIAKILYKSLIELYEPGSKPLRIITHEEALNLLKEKFGVICIDGKFFLPQSDKPVAKSLMDLRKDLCEKGLPDNTQPLEEEEIFDIARWVRCVHVKGLEDGQEINPDDLGKPIKKFMDAWTIFCNKFGCSWSPGKYKVPLTPDGEEYQVFQKDHDVYRHFAKFGIPCIPDDPGDRLNQKDRLSIELFFSTPCSLDVLNTL